MDIRLRNLDLNLLLALDRLLDTASVSAAAKELGLSQPAASRALGRLREVLDDPLLVRDGRSLVLTERARALVPAVQQAVAAVGAVFAPPDRFDPASARGEVHLAFGDEAQVAFAAPVVRAFADRAPGLDVRFHALSFATVREGRAGRIDLALTPDLAVLPPSAGRVDLSDFVLQPVYTRRFAVCWAVGRPGPPPTSLGAYVGADHVLVEFTPTGHGFVDDLLEAQGLRRRVAVTVSGFVAAARLVAETHLVATLPTELAAVFGGALLLAEPPLALPPLPMLLAWHPRATTDPRHRFVREVVAGAVAVSMSLSEQRAGGATSESSR